MSAARVKQTLLDLADVPKDGTKLAAKEVERIAREVGQQVGPVALGRKGRRTRLTAVARRFGSQANGANVVVYGKPTGPWVWVTAGTGAHTIAPRGGRGKQRTTRYLKGASYKHPYGRPVQHPGASGRGAWRRVVARAEVDVPEVFLKAVKKAVG